MRFPSICPEPSDQSDHWASRILTHGYLAALALIAVFASLAWYATITMIAAQEQVAAEINVAGRQRMLTQKVALLSSRLETVDADDRPALEMEIHACADLLERAHLTMLSRQAEALRATAAEGTSCRPGRIDPLPRGKMSDAIRDAYFTGARPVDPVLRDFLALARALPAATTSRDQLQAEIFKLAHADLPARLDAVAQIVQREGEQQIDRLMTAKTVVWIVTLIILVLEILYIFRPMTRRIEQAIESIKSLSMTLATKRRSEEEMRLTNDAQIRFLAQMSHELRTPLNAIIGYSQMLESSRSLDLPPAKRDEYVRDIRASGEHLLSLVSDLLDLSRIETDSITVNASDVDLGRVVAGVAAMLRSRAEVRNQRILIDRPAMPVAARVDERLLRQVLINLVENALKYGRDDGHVRIAFDQPDQDHVRIVVEDNGIGFDTADLPLLIEPFKRAEHGSDLAIDGVGLGLPLAKQLTEIQGGSLALASTRGVGTRAQVTVPSVERRFADAAAG